MMVELTPGCFGRPTIEGKTALGASSPAKPALHIPDPLSITSAWTSSSAIFSDEDKLMCSPEVRVATFI